MTAARVSKVDRLKEQLAAAQASLVTLEAELQPKIAAEAKRLDTMRKASDKARKASLAVYDSLNALRAEVERSLGMIGPKRVALDAQVRAWTAAKGIPDADHSELARRYINALIAADERVVDAQRQHDEANKAYDRIDREYRIAQNRGPQIAWERKIMNQREHVRKLEKEIERVPSRNAAARDRRKEAVSEEKRDADTAKARELFGEFTFHEDVS